MAKYIENGQPEAAKKWQKNHRQEMNLVIRRSTAKRYIKDEPDINRLLEIQKLVNEKIQKMGNLK